MNKLYFFLVFLLPLTPVYGYNSGFQPVYQPSLPPSGIADIHDIGNVTSIGCGVGQLLEVSALGIWICANDDTGAGGEANTASSSGVGNSLVLPKVGVDLPFRGVDCIGTVSCTTNATDLIITGTAGGGGPIALDDLTDVVITSPVYHSILSFVNGEWIDKLFAINNLSSTNGNFVTGINNKTGAITTQTFKVNNQKD